MSQLDRSRRLQAIEERIERGEFYGTSPHFIVDANAEIIVNFYEVRV